LHQVGTSSLFTNTTICFQKTVQVRGPYLNTTDRKGDYTSCIKKPFSCILLMKKVSCLLKFLQIYKAAKRLCQRCM